VQWLLKGQAFKKAAYEASDQNKAIEKFQIEILLLLNGTEYKDFTPSVSKQK
jgi:hypothetical protein